MRAEIGRCGKLFRALITFIRIGPCVLIHMDRQILVRSKPLRTHFTLNHFYLLVNDANVTPQVAYLCAAMSTNLANERLGSSVHTSVPRQMVIALEFLVTNLAWENWF